MVTQPDLKAAFDSHRGIPIEAFFAEHGIARLLDEERLRFGMSVDVRLSEHAVAATERRIRDLRGGRPTRPDTKHVKERYLRYALVVEFLPRTGVLRVADERLEALREDGGTRPGRRPFIARNGPRLSLRTEGRARPIMTELGHARTPSSPNHSILRTIRMSRHSARRCSAGGSTASNRRSYGSPPPWGRARRSDAGGGMWPAISTR